MADIKTANSFDKATWCSIFNSFSLNTIGAIGAFLVAYSQTNSWNGALLVALATYGAFLVNIPREYMRGTKVEE